MSTEIIRKLFSVEIFEKRHPEFNNPLSDFHEVMRYIAVIHFTSNTNKTYEVSSGYFVEDSPESAKHIHFFQTAIEKKISEIISERKGICK